MSQRIETWFPRGSRLVRRNRQPIIPGRGSLVVEVDMPDADNTGVLPGVPRTTYGGSLTITTPNTVLQDLNIAGNLRIRTYGVRIRNCLITGEATPVVAGAALIDADHASCLDLEAEDCSLIPTAPSRLLDGMRGHDFKASRIYVKNTVDYFGVRNPSNGELPLNVEIKQCFGEKMSYFSPDPGHSDNQTHNDGVQIQGGRGPLLIQGNRFIARYSTESGVGTTPRPDRGSGTEADGRLNWGALTCIQFTDFPNDNYTEDIGPGGEIRVWGNWLEGGKRSLNAGSAENTNVGSWLRNKFTHDQGEQGGGGNTTYTITMDPTTTCDTGSASGDLNRYIDNNAVVQVRRNQ
jgi:hypothetical protein